jgi:hypothetical protein
MAGVCEHGSDLSESIEICEFFDQLTDCQLLDHELRMLILVVGSLSCSNIFNDAFQLYKLYSVEWEM